MVAAAFAGMPAIAHPLLLPSPTPSGPQGNNSSFYPYVLNPALYQLPANVTYPGNYSLPKLGSTLLGAQPVFFLLSVESFTPASGNGSSYFLALLFTGTYSPNLAQQEFSCGAGTRDGGCGHGEPGSGDSFGQATPRKGGGQGGGDGNASCTGTGDRAHGGKGGTCPLPYSSQPISWSAPVVVNNSTFPVTSDSLAVRGSLLVVSLSFSEIFASEEFLSRDAGVTWQSLILVPGTGAEVALGNGTSVLTSLGMNLTVVTTSITSNGSGSVTRSFPSALNASPVVFADGTVGVVASLPNGTVEYLASTDSGVSFFSHLVGNFSDNSTSPVFSRIGSTNLAVPGGIGGQVSAAADNDQLFVLFTSSMDGRMEAMTVSGPDNGTGWQGPFATAAGVGSILDPQVAVSPVGFVYATWRENGNGSWKVDQAVFYIDGRLIQQPAPLPLNATLADVSAGAPTVAVDEMECPGYAWTVPSLGGSALMFSSGYLSPPGALAALGTALAQLVPSDFASPANATLDQAFLQGLLSEMEKNLSQPYPVPPGHRMNALRILETEFYPRVTSVPLVLLCTLANVSCAAGPGHHREVGNESGDDGSGAHDNETGPSPAPAGNVTDLIANQTGAFLANKYLAVYTDWLLEALGVGVLAPDPNDPTESANGDTVSASTNFVNPITARLSVSYSFTSTSTGTGSGTYTDSQGDPCYYNDYSNYGPYQATYFVGVTQQGTTRSGTFTAPANSRGSDTVYLTQLVPDQSFSWTLDLSMEYATETVHEAYCRVGSVWVGGATAGGVHPDGSVDLGKMSASASLGLSATPNPPIVQVATSVQGQSPSLHWNVSVPVQTTLSISTGATTLPPTNPTGSELQTQLDYAFPVVGPASFEANIFMETLPGASSGFSGFVLDGIGPGTSASEKLSISFPFSLWSPAPYVVPRSTVDTTPTSAVISWWTYNGELGQATARVTETWSSGALPLSTSLHGCLLFGGSAGCEYETHVTGLSGMDSYVATVSIEAVQAGVTYRGTDSIAFITPGELAITPVDKPYDSITQEGGGESLYTSINPFWGVASGYVDYYPLSNPAQSTLVPFGHLDPISRTAGSYRIDLSAGLTPNTPYGYLLALNVSLGGTIMYPFESAPGSSFYYLKDTSGDGLADSEKALGWGVTYTDARGFSHTLNVVAQANSYATNGLTSDYVEKEFGLNPNTIDTAGSHLLDTWNMTFDLGSNKSATLPSSGFEFWYENGTSSSPGLDPFAGCGPGTYACPSPRSEFSNLSHGSGADDAPWAAQQLWSASAVQKLQTLISDENVGWLRAVSGTYDGERTMTVWGKLSWGANPLAASTPSDGMADGARINPLYEVDLQVGTNGNGGGFSAGLNGCPGGLSTGDGFAVRVYVNTSGSMEFVGNMSQGLVDCNMNLGSPPSTLTLPLSNTVQFQNVSFNVLANTATCTPPSAGLSNPCGSGQNPYQIEQLAVSGCSLAYTQSVDMFNPNTRADQFVSSQGGSSCKEPQSDIFGGITTVPAGVKAPTYLWVPDDNSTLSNLPQGLQRYTGEQDFVLVVANLSSPPGTCGTCSTSPVTVPDPWGNGHDSYTLALQQSSSGQLVNFLVPRSQFFNSPMGQAVLNDTSYHYTGSSPTIPLAGISMAQLSCYWQSHAVAPAGYSVGGTSSNGPDLCAGAGTGNGFIHTDGIDPGTQYSVTTLADQENCLGSNPSPNCAAGGVPSDPYLESANPSPSIQAVLTLNLSVYDPNSANLSYLLAGLLDNSTGGVNGTMEDVTYELPSLGLNTVVMGTLANAIAKNTGVFGYPISEATPSQPSSCDWGCSLWNAVSGVVTTTIGGILEVAGAVWSATVAAVTYLNDLVPGLKSLEEQATAALVSALKTVANKLEAALQALLAFVKAETIKLLAPVFQPLLNAIDGYERALSGDLIQAQSDLNNGGSLDSDAARFWLDASGTAFYAVLGIGTTVGIALSVIEALSLGAAFLVPIAIGLLLTGAAASGAAGGNSLSSSISSFASLSSSTLLYGVIDVWKSIFANIQVTSKNGVTLSAEPQSSHTLDETLATMLHIAAISWALTVIWETLKTHEPEAEVVVGLIFGVLGMMLAGVASYFSNLAGAWISMVFAGIGAFLAVVGLLSGGDRVVGLVALLFDAGGGLLGGCVVGIAPSSLCP